MSDDRKDEAILLREYLETPQSEWVHQEIEGKSDNYEIDVRLTRPEDGTTVVVRTDAGTIRFLINAQVQAIEAENLEDEVTGEEPVKFADLSDEERAELKRHLQPRPNQ